MSERTRGRPRSVAVQQAALSATAELLRESGYDDLTMVGVAARARIGKQTLYRWWPSKAALVTECVLTGILPIEPAVPVATGDPERDLRTWWDLSRRMLRDESRAPIYRALSAAASADPDAASRLAVHLSAPLEQSLSEVLLLGAQRGAIRADVSSDAVSRLLLGALMFDVLTGGGGPEGDQALDLLLRGILSTNQATTG